MISLGEGERRDLSVAVNPVWGRMRRVWFAVFAVAVGVEVVEGDGEVERVVGWGVLSSTTSDIGEEEAGESSGVVGLCQEQRVKGWLW